MAIFHASIDLDAIIHRGDAARMAGHVRLPGGEDWATEAEILAYATILKAKGFEAMPTCSCHDSRGNCTGVQSEAGGDGN